MQRSFSMPLLLVRAPRGKKFLFPTSLCDVIAECVGFHAIDLVPLFSPDGLLEVSPRILSRFHRFHPNLATESFQVIRKILAPWNRKRCFALDASNYGGRRKRSPQGMAEVLPPIFRGLILNQGLDPKWIERWIVDNSNSRRLYGWEGQDYDMDEEEMAVSFLHPVDGATSRSSSFDGRLLVAHLLRWSLVYSNMDLYRSLLVLLKMDKDLSNPTYSWLARFGACLHRRDVKMLQEHYLEYRKENHPTTTISEEDERRSEGRRWSDPTRETPNGPDLLRQITPHLFSYDPSISIPVFAVSCDPPFPSPQELQDSILQLLELSVLPWDKRLQLFAFYNQHDALRSKMSHANPGAESGYEEEQYSFSRNERSQINMNEILCLLDAGALDEVEKMLVENEKPKRTTMRTGRDELPRGRFLAMYE